MEMRRSEKARRWRTSLMEAFHFPNPPPPPTFSLLFIFSYSLPLSKSPGPSCNNSCRVSCTDLEPRPPRSSYFCIFFSFLSLYPAGWWVIHHSQPHGHLCLLAELRCPLFVPWPRVEPASAFLLQRPHLYVKMWTIINISSMICSHFLSSLWPVLRQFNAPVWSRNSATEDVDPLCIKAVSLKLTQTSDFYFTVWFISHGIKTVN